MERPTAALVCQFGRALPRWLRQIARRAHRACSSQCQTFFRVPADGWRRFTRWKSRGLRPAALVQRLEWPMVQDSGSQSGVAAQRACPDAARPVASWRGSCFASLRLLWLYQSAAPPDSIQARRLSRQKLPQSAWTGPIATEKATRDARVARMCDRGERARPACVERD